MTLLFERNLVLHKYKPISVPRYLSTTFPVRRLHQFTNREIGKQWARYVFPFISAADIKRSRRRSFHGNPLKLTNIIGLQKTSPHIYALSPLRSPQPVCNFFLTLECFLPLPLLFDTTISCVSFLNESAP